MSVVTSYTVCTNSLEQPQEVNVAHGEKVSQQGRSTLKPSFWVLRGILGSYSQARFTSNKPYPKADEAPPPLQVPGQGVTAKKPTSHRAPS